MSKQIITVLGATGSIGLSTLDVVARHPEDFEVYALTGHRQIAKLAELCQKFDPVVAVVMDQDSATQLRQILGQSSKTVVLVGSDALEQVASAPEVTTVMAAIVGAAGLGASLAAARAGKRLLLANKEALVMAGEVFIQAIRSSNATLLPIDSEHNAIFQSLPKGFDYGLKGCGVNKIILTASGGPFRKFSVEQLKTVTPAQACAHPNWVMGKKISVDSATMMNKGLEVIEAHWLFGIEAQRISVLIHPESVIHSMVEYSDGSVLAQLGNPDMRTPIAHALAYPSRIEAGVSPLNLSKIGSLSFEDPDFCRFPCLKLAYDVLQEGGSASTCLNAANEIAVEAFLSGRLMFNQISQIVASVLDKIQTIPLADLETVTQIDRDARELSQRLVTDIS